MMRITIENTDEPYTNIEVGEAKATTVDDAIRLCENALSAHFGYGVKILGYDTYLYRGES